MARIVIVDAGPLIALARIRHVDLLNQLFGPVQVTSVVVDEVLHGGDFPDASVLALALRQTSLWCVNRPSPEQLSQANSLMNLYQIDHGEASSMALGQQAQTEGGRTLLVMDDGRGRSAAQHANLPVVGTVGVLLLAKQQGLVSHIKSLLLDLHQHGYFLSQRLIDGALQQARE